MTQKPMTLTKEKKLAKIYKLSHISDAISPTDFILAGFTLGPGHRSMTY